MKLITLEIIIAYGYMRMHDMWIKTLLIMDEVSKVTCGERMASHTKSWKMIMKLKKKVVIL